MKLSSIALFFGMAPLVALAAPAQAQSGYDEPYTRNMPALEFVGFYCSRLQQDAVVNPANEITIDITVSGLESGYRRSFKFPERFAYYDNVRKDFMISELGVELWRGEPEDMTVDVVMTEHDGSEDLVPSGTETLGSYSVDVTNDPGAGDWWEDQTKYVRGTNNYVREGQITQIDYHFRTEHTGGGALCYAYFKWAQTNDTYYDASYGPTQAKDFEDFEPNGFENYSCDLGREQVEVDPDGFVYYQGGRNAIGERTEPGDRDCFFEVKMFDGAYRNRRLCMGDLGNVFMQSSRGRKVGECYACGRDPCG